MENKAMRAKRTLEQKLWASVCDRVEQDWDKGETVYVFSDYSTIVCTGPDVECSFLDWEYEEQGIAV